MKVAVVPAQVTTIEDKVAGGLGLKQLVLLVTPVFLSGIVYGILPPNFNLSAYKIIVITLLFISIGSLAVKIKGILVLNWLLIFARYNARPRWYVYDKNSLVLRPTSVVVRSPQKRAPQVVVTRSAHPPTSPLTTHEQFTMEALMNHPASKLHFKTDKKGNLHVAISKTV
ncbi:hypothetical protein D9M69_482590 [compost metagenome]